MEYEYIDERSINQNLKCSFCHDPFEKPVTTPCEHTFCYQCIEQWLTNENSCPICRRNISNIRELTPVKVRLVLNMLDSLLVKCKTCGQTGIERGYFKDHLKICRKRNICLCPASDIRCPWTGRNEQLPLHLSQCPYEQIRPVLSKILQENLQLEQQTGQIMEQYGKERNTGIEELRIENQQLKEQVDKLKQKCRELKLEIKDSSNKTKQISNEVSSVPSSIVRTISFESLLQKDKFGSIPNGFSGLNWMNVRYTNEENARAIRPRKREERLHIFLRGFSCVAYNDWKNPMIISSTKQNFTLHACEIMSTNHLEDICKLDIIARKDKMPIHSKSITLKRHLSEVVEFNSWIDINQVEFSINKTYFILAWIRLE